MSCDTPLRHVGRSAQCWPNVFNVGPALSRPCPDIWFNGFHLHLYKWLTKASSAIFRMKIIPQKKHSSLHLGRLKLRVGMFYLSVKQFANFHLLWGGNCGSNSPHTINENRLKFPGSHTDWVTSCKWEGWERDGGCWNWLWQNGCRLIIWKHPRSCVYDNL